MPLLKRFGFYFVGLAIGIVFLTFFFKKKSEETGTEFCYFPNCRTLKDIRSKSVFYSEAVEAQLAKGTLDSLDIIYLLRNGEVNFGKSATKSTPCRTYLIEGEIKNKNISLRVQNCPSRAVMEKVTIASTSN